MKRLFWMFGLAVLCMLASYSIWYTQKDVRQHIVFRIPGGFIPNVVRVEEKESLRFINLTFRPTWPAAGPHPTHITYPDFDAIGGIAPGHTWVFTFEKGGTYTFHDHYAPEVNGIVVSGLNDISQVTEESTCTALPDLLQQAACAEIYFKNVASKETYPKARELFNDLATRYPRSCHNFAHDLGKNAYVAYLENNLFDIGQEASLCNNGFWHGFTTAMQTYSGIEAAKEFCASLRGETEMHQNSNRINCYHGIGIGLIPDPPPAHLWGEFQQLVDPALAFCATIQGDESYKERCLTGVFHAVSDYMSRPLYGFTFDESSLTICSKQAIAYQKTCFITLVAAVPASVDFDLVRTVAIIKESAPPYLFSDIFFHAAIMLVPSKTSVEAAGRFAASCEAQSSDIRSLCISAVINKLFSYSVPGTEYQEAIAFCSSTWIHDVEQLGCFQEMISYANTMYTKEKVAEVCDSIPEIYYSSISGCYINTL